MGDTLRLTLKKAPFDVMVTGEKMEEFREPSRWIRSRLFNRDGTPRSYDFIEYTNGYGADRPRFTTNFVGFEHLDRVSRRYSNGLTIDSDSPLFVIKHTRILSKQNI
jgi:hypothetical protein